MPTRCVVELVDVCIVVFSQDVPATEEHVSNPQNPQNSLEELKRRLAKAQEVVVDQKGKLHLPEDSAVADKPAQDKTVVKPQRWF